MNLLTQDDSVHVMSSFVPLFVCVLPEIYRVELLQAQGKTPNNLLLSVSCARLTSLDINITHAYSGFNVL